MWHLLPPPMIRNACNFIRRGNPAADLPLIRFEFAPFASVSQSAADPLIGSVGELLLCVEALLAVKLHFKVHAVFGDPSRVDPFVVRVIPPVVPAVDHLVSTSL